MGILRVERRNNKKAETIDVIYFKFIGLEKGTFKRTKWERGEIFAKNALFCSCRLYK
jgi:hypothetical protein